MKINVLYLIDRLDYGGAEKQLVELINSIDTENYGVHLCCLKPSGPLYDELSVLKETIPFKGFGRLSIIGSVGCLARYIQENDIHIVQTFFQDPFLLAALTKLRCRFKLLGTFLDLGFWRTPSENFKMRFAYRFFDGFIANSQAVKQHFVDTDGLASEKVHVIYNGFDFQKVEEWTREDNAPEKLRVGIVANLNRPVKRIQDFIEAAAIVYEKYPNTSFLIAGDGHLKTELQALAASRGIGSVVDFLGRIPNPLDFVRLLDVGVLCSESEGFSNSIIEYMACEVPVVATNVGGNPELVIDGENGYLTPVGQPRIIAEKINRLLGDDALRRQIGEKNRGKIKQEFSLAVLADKHEKLYREIVSI